MEIFKVWQLLTFCVSGNVIALDSIYKRKLQKVYTSENVFLHRFLFKKSEMYVSFAYVYSFLKSE